MFTGTRRLLPFGGGRAAIVPHLFWPLFWMLAFQFLSLSAGAQGEEPTASKEYQLKAALLYSFTKYIEWPPSRFSSADAPIVIGVMGNNPFGEELNKVVEGRKVNGHGFTVKFLHSLKEISSVHVLFVPAGQEPLVVGDTLDLIQAPGVLTVGETEQFTVLGGVITFVSALDKVHFEVNRDSAARGGIKISQQLLKLSSHGRKKI